jgi:dihydroorotate dehydrogenase
MPIIGVGGISTPDEAWDMLRAGADLLQVYTGLIYEGPFLPRRINLKLAARLKAEHISSLAEMAPLLEMEAKQQEDPELRV